MEGDVSSASSCVPISKLMEYSLSHDPFSPPLPMREEAMPAGMDSSEVALMGNLLTDMLSSDFLYASSSRYPEILQNFPTDQASKMTLLQMLEDSSDTTTSSYSVHLKLPVLEEAQAPEQHKLLSQQQELLQQQQHQQQLSVLLLPTSPRGEGLIGKACKPEMDPLLEEQQQQQAPMVLDNRNNLEQQQQQKAATSANSEENSSDKLLGLSQSSSGTETQQTTTTTTRPKRKRVKTCKNSEEVESQRQTHIAVERNRRKQMNEHLTVLRALMPGSYVQKGDQASIIGGAIEFVKELEQLLQCLQAQKRRRLYSEVFSPKQSPTNSTMLQQQQQQQQASSGGVVAAGSCSVVPYSPDSSSKFVNDNFFDPVTKELLSETKSEVAEVEVRMTGLDAVVKILSQRRPGQLLKTISALESMCLSIVHTNVTTIEQTVLYSFTVKLGVECRLSAQEISEAIHRAFGVFHSSIPAAASATAAAAAAVVAAAAVAAS